jgi:aminomethyltransferase
MVVNASNKDKDFEWMNVNNKQGVEIVDQSDEYNILAVQGPKSGEVLQKICNRTLNLEYYHFFEAKCSAINIIISRTGYTGEIGYELYFRGDDKKAKLIWDLVFEAGKEFNIQPIGLGARDTLRLEMGYCLYGNDIDQTTNPLEAGLDWITKLNKENFIAKDVLLKVKAAGLKRKLIPMISGEKAFPRHGYNISVDGQKIGTITSGTVSPVLEKAIALGYVDSVYIKEGANVNFQIRDREIPATITKLPFLKKLK